MSEEQIPLQERVTNYYSQLSSVAADLNAVSDELGKSISEIDVALKKLNLGIATWVTIRGADNSPSDDSFWSRDIGYAKISNKWGISLRTIDGQSSDPDRSETEEWLFNDAPRSLRLEAIDKIPELLEQLSKEAVRTTKNIRARLSEAQAVAEALKSASNRTLRVPLRIPDSNSKPKIDLTHVSKPGDVLKAILTDRQIRQDNASEASTASASVAPNLDSVRGAVVHALSKAGHESAAKLLGMGSWTFDGSCFGIEVAGMGKKILALTVNMAAEKVIRQELLRLNVPMRFVVAPAEKTTKPIPVSNPLIGASTEVK